MAGREQRRNAELEEIYSSISKSGNLSKYWSRVDEVIHWLEGLEEYEKCAELAEIKKAINNEDSK